MNSFLRTGRLFLPALCLALFVLVSGCDDSSITAPESESTPDTAIPGADADLVGLDAEFNAIATDVAGFGGAYYDDAGTLHVVLTDAVAKSSATLQTVEQKLADVLPAPSEKSSLGTQVQVGDYDFTELSAWSKQALDAFALPGVHTIDVDEKANRIRVQVENGPAMLEASHLLEQKGVPAEAVILEEAPRPETTASLRDRVRPLRGGLQIAFSNSLCTFGFNANRAGVRGFVTNSHCTVNMFQVTGIAIYQNLPSGSNYIGYETVDPALYGNYRYSDAAFIRSTTSDNGSGIYRTTARAYQTGSGSLTINGVLNITGVQGYPAAGQVLDKVGRTTGWTSGPVTATCQTINMGSYILYCQDEVYASVNGGDSGSPVFVWDGGSGATLAGILWGKRTYSNGTVRFLMSSWPLVNYDLGGLSPF